jgi:hypothetical protein
MLWIRSCGLGASNCQCNTPGFNPQGDLRGGNEAVLSKVLADLKIKTLKKEN